MTESVVLTVNLSLFLPPPIFVFATTSTLNSRPLTRLCGERFTVNTTDSCHFRSP